jgi:predicted nucleic acid-binding protein
MRYVDTSVLVPLFRDEAVSLKAEDFLGRQPAGCLAISHWTRVEFASAFARDVRMGLHEKFALQAIGEFEQLVAESFITWLPTAADYELARSFVQRFASKLRAGDALHLAIAKNHGAEMVYTLDEGLLSAARLLKVRASKGIRS